MNNLYDDPAYIEWCEEQEKEHELEMKHGGRTRCPNCDQFEVEHRTVNTGYDPSDFARCRSCGYEEFAG